MKFITVFTLVSVDAFDVCSHVQTAIFFSFFNNRDIFVACGR